jgi:hypothetical protein
VVVGEGEGVCDGAAWAVLQETEAGIAMGGVEHYYCTPQRPHSQKHNLALERRDPLRAGKTRQLAWGGIACRGIAAARVFRKTPSLPLAVTSRARAEVLCLRLLAGWVEVEGTRLLDSKRG